MIQRQTKKGTVLPYDIFSPGHAIFITKIEFVMPAFLTAPFKSLCKDKLKVEKGEEDI